MSLASQVDSLPVSHHVEIRSGKKKVGMLTCFIYLSYSKDVLVNLLQNIEEQSTHNNGKLMVKN